MIPFLFMAPDDREPGKSRFGQYAWGVLAYSVLVILWGTVVRATRSGAGCGDHWPLCGGQAFPHAAKLATFIEFAHRASSGVVVVLVVGLVVWAFRHFPAKHPARRYAGAALFFTVTEGLLGAALVLYGGIGTGASVSLVFILSLHLVNTFLLLASLALTAQSAGEPVVRSGKSGPIPGLRWSPSDSADRRRGFWSVAAADGPPAEAPARRPKAMGRRADRPLYFAYGAGLIGTLAIAITGTIAALADSLFRATSLAQGFQWDFSGSASPILRLRIIHPVVAVFIGVFLMILALHPLIRPAPRPARRIAPYLLILVLLQFCLGALNVALLSPLWIQVLHLLTADLIWITLVLLSAAVLQPLFEAVPAVADPVADSPAFAEDGSAVKSAATSGVV
jgi:heme A synthase